MESIIEWCNINNGFLTAIMSLVGLIISTIAIIVSIKTARLPYKKKILITHSIDIGFYSNPMLEQTGTDIVGMSVNATNVGARNVNITYLGISVKDRSLTGGQNKMTKIRDKITGTGVVPPTEIKTEFYKKEDIILALTKINGNAKVFLYVRDSEGQEYIKRIGNAKNIIKTLSV